MKRFVLCLAGLMLSFVPILLWGTLAFAITGGELDGADHPNTGLLSMPDPNNTDTQRPLCSGILIHKRVFLTAGHCTDFLETRIAAGQFTVDGVKVSFDSGNALVNGLLDVEAIITHTDYRGVVPLSHKARDVGVVILKDPVTTITPQNLPSEGFLDQLEAEGKLRSGAQGAKFTVVGYGTTLDWPPPDIIAPDGKRRRAVSEFLNLRQVWLHMSQNMAPGRGDEGTCFGDSGGPTFWTDGDGTKILVALTSWGDAVCVATGTAYRTDTAVALDFINQQISEVNGAPPATRQVKRLTTTWGAIKQGR